MDLALASPLTASVQSPEETLDAEVVWLDTGRAHTLLQRRLKVGTEWLLTIPHGDRSVVLTVRILAVRVRPEIKNGPRVLHLCSLDFSQEGPGPLEDLLREVNPSVAPPAPTPPPSAEADEGFDDALEAESDPDTEHPSWENQEQPATPAKSHDRAWDFELESSVSDSSMSDSSVSESSVSGARTDPSASRTPPPPEPLSTEAPPTPPKKRARKPAARKKDSSKPTTARKRSRRLPPQRRLGRNIPKASTSLSARTTPTAARPEKPRSKKGLRSAELTQPEFYQGSPPRVVVSFSSTDLWRRSARTGEGWFQLTLSDVSDVPDAEALSLVMTLPTGVNIRATAQVVRRSRGRMILEARNLPESTQEALRLVT